MSCNNTDSKELIKAVYEQTNTLNEQGGFCTDKEYSQFIRDTRDVARKLYIAEQIITVNSLAVIYKKALKLGVIDE